jgi:multisubunit Na+/H+ antiporter MnhF subunit
LNWQVASVLLAGIIVALGLSLSRPVANPFDIVTAIVSFLGIVAVSAWYLLIRRNRDYSPLALARARQIAEKYGGTFIRNAHDARNQRLELTIDGAPEPFSIGRPKGSSVLKFTVILFLTVLGATMLYSLIRVIAVCGIK